MLMMASDDKTEEATPKRKREARQKGQVAKSADLASGFTLIVMFQTLRVFGNYITNILAKSIEKYTQIFNDYSEQLVADDVMQIMIDVIVTFLAAVLPLLAVALVVGIFINIAQVGFLKVKDALKPKFEKLNPVNGFKRIFSMNAVVELIKALLKFSILGYLLYSELKKNFSIFANFAMSDIRTTISIAIDLILNIAVKLGMALFFIGVADFIYQKLKLRKDLRMTKQEVKDEYKQMEGDPKVKSKIKQKQMKMSMARMVESMKNANFVVTNPTHYAVAVEYDEKKHNAPVVVAKGKDYVAIKLKEKAKEYGIEMVENKPLARALYATVEIGREVPSEFYVAIAEILVNIYNMKKNKTRTRR